MGKTRELHIRLKEEDYDFMVEQCELFECNKTDLITELIRRGEYTVLKYDDLKEFNKVFGNIGNNINQIARALNILKKNQNMNEDELHQIIKLFEDVKNEYVFHQLGSDKLLRKIYRVKLEKNKLKELENQMDYDST